MTSRNRQKLLARMPQPAANSGPQATPAPDFLRNPGSLTVGKPGDAHEQEANRTADTVLHSSAPTIQGRAASGTPQAEPLAGESAAAQPDTSVVNHSGQPLSAGTRSFFEPRFGHDFSAVRIHADEPSAQAAQSMNARAFTVGSDIVFNAGQYAPETSAGKHLLAHELTHVVQQSADPSPAVEHKAQRQIQGSFFGDVWSGIKSAASTVWGGITTAAEAVGGAVSSAAQWVGGALTTAANWVGERVHDASMWLVNLIRDLPERLKRLATTLWEGLKGIITFAPELIEAFAHGGWSGLADFLWQKAKSGAAWVGTAVLRILDLFFGLPEIGDFIFRLLAKARHLTGPERAASESVLGAGAIRYDDVRVSEGGILVPIFALNNARAFATFHTINLPPNETMDTVVHETVHILQYEKVGTLYLAQAAHAQSTLGANAYNYGDLTLALANGKHYRDFTREQQGQIAQDYYKDREAGNPTAKYDPFIAELRAGDI